MDTYAFIVGIIGATSWPIAAVAIALIFRGEFAILLSRLRRSKLGPAEFEFESAIRELEAEATGEVGAVAAVLHDVSSRATEDPRIAVLNAWLKIESAAVKVALKEGLVTEEEAQNPMRALAVMEKSSSLDPYYTNLLKELRYLRNRAAHEMDFRPSSESVALYVGLAYGVYNELATRLR